jgi:PKD repeat protein
VGNIDGWDWSFGDAGGSIAIDVENPVFTYPANGTYTAELTVSGDEGNFTYERNVAVTTCLTGLTDLEGLTNFDVFPSPATDFVSINVGLSAAQDLEVGLYNAQGQLVASDRIQGALNYQHSFDVSGLAEGLYQIKLQNGDRFSTKAFVVQ